MVSADGVSVGQYASQQQYGHRSLGQWEPLTPSHLQPFDHGRWWVGATTKQVRLLCCRSKKKNYGSLCWKPLAMKRSAFLRLHVTQNIALSSSSAVKKICLIPALPVHSFFSQTLQHKVIYIVKTEPGFILSWFRHVYLKRNMTMLYFLLLIGLILFRWDICRRCIHIFFFSFFLLLIQSVLMKHDFFS